MDADADVVLEVWDGTANGFADVQEKRWARRYWGPLGARWELQQLIQNLATNEVWECWLCTISAPASQGDAGDGGDGGGALGGVSPGGAPSAEPTAGEGGGTGGAPSAEPTAGEGGAAPQAEPTTNASETTAGGADIQMRSPEDLSKLCLTL